MEGQTSDGVASRRLYLININECIIEAVIRLSGLSFMWCHDAHKSYFLNVNKWWIAFTPFVVDLTSNWRSLQDLSPCITELLSELWAAPQLCDMTTSHGATLAHSTSDTKKIHRRTSGFLLISNISDNKHRKLAISDDALVVSTTLFDDSSAGQRHSKRSLCSAALF